MPPLLLRARLALPVFVGLQAALAQNPVPPPTPSGLQVRSVTAHFDYYSSALPNGAAAQSSPLLSDAAAGASFEIGRIQSSERSSSSFIYSSSLTARTRYSEWNAWNHSLSFTASYIVVPRWTLALSAAGHVSTLEQALFSQTTLSNLAGVPASFDDLAAAMLTSKFNNPQLAAVLRSAPLPDSLLSNLLYGDRMLTSAAQASLSYSYSPRLTILVEGGAARNQRLFDRQAVAALNPGIVSDTTSGTAAVSAMYSLSPRTQVGVVVSGGRVSSSFQDAYSTTSLATLGHKFGRRWILRMHAGAGMTIPLRQAFHTTPAPLPVAAASLAFKTLSHTVLGSVERTVSDSFGLGAATSSTASVSWHWTPAFRRWWIETSIGWQQLGGNGAANTSGWRLTAGFGRMLAPHVALLTQYAYLDSAGRLQQLFYRQDQTAIRVSVVWMPHSPEPH